MSAPLRSGKRILDDRGRAVIRLHQMSIDLQRERRGPMAEAAADRQHVEARRNQGRGAGMPQAVQRDLEACPRRSARFRVRARVVGVARSFPAGFWNRKLVIS
jgi:hypothetical protein